MGMTLGEDATADMALADVLSDAADHPGDTGVPTATPSTQQNSIFGGYISATPGVTVTSGYGGSVASITMKPFAGISGSTLLLLGGGGLLLLLASSGGRRR